MKDLLFAFDLLETSFSLESLREPMERLGLPTPGLELWFSRVQRDCFALQVTGQYIPLPAVARGTLEVVLASFDLQPDDEALDAFVDGLRQLDPQPDFVPALRRLRSRGAQAIVVANSPEALIRALLVRAQAADLVRGFVSSDEVNAMKPDPRVYLRAAEKFDRAPAEVVLFSAHAWDVHGAKNAGCQAGFVLRSERPFPRFLHFPDDDGHTLLDLVDAFTESSGVESFEPLTE